jgi:cyclomaltodextrinase
MMPVPDWVRDAIFYQIFPDRFANGETKNDPSNVQTWGSKPTIHGFQGGDLRGVIDHFNYLLDLGINAIYFNPIFKATSNHRYNTTDYFMIDPKLGTLEDFLSLLNLAHYNNVKVILDGVFNHCGRGFFAFQDIMENQEYSAYVDWYHIHHFPVRAYGSVKAQDYDAWWGFSSLPKFNTENPEVRSYLLNVARFWIEQGADGWRLDVPNEINDDVFWAEFRKVVKAVKKEAYLLGEIWEINPRWVGDNHFDGLMNYPFRETLIQFFIKGELTPTDFGSKLEKLLLAYPYEHNFAHLLPLSTHDTERILTISDGDKKRVRLMALIQFFFPGAPNIYYGDEIGMEGGKDPDCRRAFLWDESTWDMEQHSFVKRLIQIRHKNPQLRRGGFERLVEDDALHAVVFSRSLGERRAYLIINASEKQIDLQEVASKWVLPMEKPLWDAINESEIVFGKSGMTIKIPPLEGLILIDQDMQVSP